MEPRSCRVRLQGGSAPARSQGSWGSGEQALGVVGQELAEPGREEVLSLGG